jgi:MFS family permease
MAAGVIGSGMVVDWLGRRGHRDAHLRVFIGALACGAPLGIVAFLLDDATAFLALIFLFKLTAFSYWGYAAAAIQAVTPVAYRGKASGVYLLMLALFGGSLGPSLVALVSTHLFHDPQMLGASIALLIALLAPAAAGIAWLGLKPMRTAVAWLEEPDGLARGVSCGR